MITVMRKHHKILMIFITILVCISFSWYWNRTDFSTIGNAAVGKFHDRVVSQVEYQRNSRLLRLAGQLGMRDLAQDLTAGAQSESDAFQNFAWNLMVLRYEGNQLGIEPTASEIANEVKTLPAFHGKDGFDLTAYGNFVDHALGPMGFSQAEIEELAAEQIVLKRVKKMLNAGVSIPENDLRRDFEQAYAKMDVSVVRFRTEDFAKDTPPSDDEVTKYFDSHKAELKTDETRKVKFVQFGLTDEQKKLTGRPRVEVLQKLADQANDFIEALQAKGADFDQVATKFQITPKETGEFAKAKPDPALGESPALAQAAFGLTKETPNSEPVQTKDGFDILHLIDVQPSHPLTKEDARPRIVEALKKQASQEAVANKGNEVASKLREDLQSGKTIEQAATDAGVKPETLPPFALVDALPGVTPPPKPEKKDESPDMESIKQAASSLSPGTVSDYLNTAHGGLVVVLEKREDLGPAAFEKARSFLEDRTMDNKGAIVFYQWLRDRRHAAGITETEQPTPAAG